MARTLEWHAPDGTVIPMDLSGLSSGVVAGRSQAFASLPPVRVTATQTPFRSGSALRGLVWDDLEVSVPVHVIGSDLEDLERQWSALARAVDPTAGTGHLVVTRHDGAVRRLPCRLVDGMAVAERHDSLTAWSTVLAFRAFSPFWESGGPEGERIVQVAISEPSGEFFPIFPLVLGTGGAELVTITVDGDGPVWPTWTVPAPWSDVSLIHLGTGERLTITGGLTSGEVVISTEDRSVVTDTGASLLQALGDGSTFFQLTPGVNELVVSAGGAAGQLVTISWRDRYLGA